MLIRILIYRRYFSFLFYLSLSTYAKAYLSLSTYAKPYLYLSTYTVHTLIYTCDTGYIDGCQKVIIVEQ